MQMQQMELAVTYLAERRSHGGKIDEARSRKADARRRRHVEIERGARIDNGIERVVRVKVSIREREAIESEGWKLRHV